MQTKSRSFARLSRDAGTESEISYRGKRQAGLLENSGLLLVSAEDGRVVLLRADPGEHSEAGSFKGLEGKTWNHPVVVGDRLYVRNAQEAACYQLTFADTKAIAARF